MKIRESSLKVVEQIPELPVDMKPELIGFTCEIEHRGERVIGRGRSLIHLFVDLAEKMRAVNTLKDINVSLQ